MMFPKKAGEEKSEVNWLFAVKISTRLERVHIKRASKIIANIMTERKIESSLS